LFPPFACNLIYFLGAFFRATACSELSILQYYNYVNVQFRHFLAFVFKHFSQTRDWVRVFCAQLLRIGRRSVRKPGTVGETRTFALATLRD